MLIEKQDVDPNKDCSCILCGEDAEWPMVMLYLQDEDVWLHPKCAVYLGEVLEKDGWRGMIEKERREKGVGK